MAKLNTAGAIKSIQMELKKRSPELLTGVGIAGLLTTTALAVKATPKALMLIEEEKYRVNEARREEALDRGQDVYDEVQRLTPIEAIKASWKCYTPAAVTCTMSIFCIIGASSVNARRNAALATAYTLSESAFKDYREKVIETVGDKKEKVVREAVTKDKLERTPVASSQVVITEKGGTLCYDPMSGRYFKSDIDAIKKAINELNHRMFNHSYISLNEFYSEIGLGDTEVGNYIGWNISKDLIDIEFDSHLASDGTPAVVLDYVVRPDYNFDRWM